MASSGRTETQGLIHRLRKRYRDIGTFLLGYDNLGSPKDIPYPEKKKIKVLLGDLSSSRERSPKKGHTPPPQMLDEARAIARSYRDLKEAIENKRPHGKELEAYVAATSKSVGVSIALLEAYYPGSTKTYYWP